MNKQQERNKLLSIFLLFAVSMLVSWTKAPDPEERFIQNFLSIQDRLSDNLNEMLRVVDVGIADMHRTKDNYYKAWGLADDYLAGHRELSEQEWVWIKKTIEEFFPTPRQESFMSYVRTEVWPAKDLAIDCDDQLRETVHYYAKRNKKMEDISEFTDWAKCIGMFVGTVKQMKARYPEYVK